LIQATAIPLSQTLFNIGDSLSKVERGKYAAASIGGPKLALRIVVFSTPISM